MQPAMCGVTTTFSSWRSGLSGVGGSGSVTSRKAKIRPVASSSIRAPSSMMVPRAVLISTAPSLRRPSSSPSIMCLVSSVAGAWIDTTSQRSISSANSTLVTPSCWASSSPRYGSATRMVDSNPASSSITWRPTLPTPIRPTVDRLSSRASQRSQTPLSRQPPSRTWLPRGQIRLRPTIIRPNVVSATSRARATEALVTLMPRSHTAADTKRFTLPPMWAKCPRRGAAATTSASSGATPQLVMQASASPRTASRSCLPAGSSPGWWTASAASARSARAASLNIRR